MPGPARFPAGNFVVRVRLLLCLACLFGFVFVPVGMTGCSLGSPDRRRGSLTEAAEEAEKDSSEKKKAIKSEAEAEPEEEEEVVHTAEPEEPAVAADASAALTQPGDSVAIAYEEPVEDRWVLSLVSGGGSVDNSDFEGFGAFGVGVCGVKQRIRWDLFLFYMPTNLTESSGVVEALVDEREWAADVRFRYLITPTHTFSGIYGVGGLRFGLLEWDYKNGVIVENPDSTTEELNHDMLGYFGLYLGLGVMLVQTDHFMLGTDATAGFKHFKSETQQGFEQDLFDGSILFGQLLLSADWRF